MSSEEKDYVGSGDIASIKAARETREWADGNLDDKVSNKFIYKHAGLVASDKARTVLNRIAKAYEPRSPEAPSKWWELDVVEVILKEQGTELVQKALEERNMTLLDSLMGLINYEKDMGNVKTWAKFNRLMSGLDTNICYYFGHMGFGKTYFARLHVENWKLEYPDHKIIANTGMEDAEFTNQYSRIKEVLEERQGKDNATRLMVFIDEAAQLFSGFGGGISRGEDMAQLLKLGRKADADFIFIGQDGKDITAQIRALCTVFVHKTGKKTASFYRDVKNREGVGEIMEVKNVPLPDEEPDTKDVATLEFDTEDDEDVSKEKFEREKEKWEQMAIAAMDFKSDITQQELADEYGTNPRQIRRWKKKFSEKLEGLGFDQLEYPEFD